MSDLLFAWVWGSPKGRKPDPTPTRKGDHEDKVTTWALTLALTLTLSLTLALTLTLSLTLSLTLTLPLPLSLPLPQTAAGSVTANAAPPSTRFAASIEPPRRSTIV